MTIRVTLGFSSGRYSWTESHLNAAYSSVAQLPQTPPPSIAGLANARAQVLGGGAAITRIRCSNWPQNRLTVDYLAGSGFSGASPFTPLAESNFSNRGYQAAPAGFALSALAYDSVGRQTRLFLAGMPQGIFVEDAPNGLGWDFGGFGSVLLALQAYFGYFANASGVWGWETQVSESTYPVTFPLLTNAAYPGMIGVTTSGQLFPPLTPAPQEIYLKGFRRLSTRSPGLSGHYWHYPPVLVATVGGLTTYTYFLQNTGLVNPANFLTKSPPQIGNWTPTFTPYLFAEADYATTRKRGASFGRPRGKSSIRI
jgi:hypothetical protein